jgi:hypothetical protein
MTAVIALVSTQIPGLTHAQDKQRTRRLEMQIKRRLAVSALAICLLLALPGVAHAGPADFTGHWQGIDVDGSDVRITITGPMFGPFEITRTESYISYCNGEPGMISGTGSLTNPFLMEADLDVECLTTDQSTIIHVAFEHQPPIDTLVVDYGHPWGSFGCHRPGSAPMPSAATIIALVAGDGLWTADFAANDMLTISVYESDHPGAELLWTGEEEANEWGFVQVHFRETHNLDLVPGNHVTVSDSFLEKGLVLESFTWDIFDTTTDVMAGTAPPGREVLVVVADSSEPESQSCLGVVADRDGNWTADFSTIDVDIPDDEQVFNDWRMWSFAWIFDRDGDTIEASPRDYD